MKCFVKIKFEEFQIPPIKEEFDVTLYFIQYDYLIDPYIYLMFVQKKILMYI